MSISEYINRHYILLNTPFKITSEGKGYYLEGEKMYTREEFHKKYQMPISLVSHNRPNYDGTKNYLYTD